MAVIKAPFTLETATAKVRAGVDAWNSRGPEQTSLVYSENSKCGLGILESDPDLAEIDPATTLRPIARHQKFEDYCHA